MLIQLRTPDGKVYDPLPTQRAFHASDATYKAFIAGFGAGKTLAGCYETLLSALEYPRGDFLVARFTYRELLATTWDTLVKITPPEIITDLNKKDPSMTIKNGSRIIGWNLADGRTMRSLNLSGGHIDEVTEVGEDAFNEIAGRLRNPIGPRRLWVTGNPAGRDWVYQRFVAKALPGHAFFHAPTSQNTHLPDTYIENLRLVYDDDWIAKFLEGSFDVFTGQILDTFRRELHVVQPFAPPMEWPRFRGLDHGWTNPTACAWLGRDFEGNYLIYRNYYKRNSIPAENAAAILALSEGEVIDWTVIDPSAQQTQTGGGTAERIVDQYRAAGLYCQLGNNDVRASISLIRQLLQPDPLHRFPAWHHRAGEMGAPWFFVTADCEELIFEILQWQWRQVRPGGIDKEIPLARHDHCFVAGTRIETPSGPVPIEEMMPGMAVCTRKGPRQVLAAWQSAPAADCVKATFSDGRELVGTSDHPVWSESAQDWVDMAALRYCDIIRVWKPSSSSTESSFGAIPTRRLLRIASTLSRTYQSGWQGWGRFIRRFGRPISDLSLTGMRLIIGIKTRSTMRWRTWSASPLPSIDPVIERIAEREGAALASLSFSPEYALWRRKERKDEQRPKPVMPILFSEERGSGRATFPRQRLAISADRYLKTPPCSAALGSALTTANPHGEGNRALTTSTGPVSSAGQPSGSTGMPENAAAAVRVVSVTASGRHPVYNLTVEDTPEYFANGILVHNCIAAVRYLLMNSPRPAQETIQQNQYERFIHLVAEMEGKPARDPDEIDYSDIIGNQHLRAGRV